MHTDLELVRKGLFEPFGSKVAAIGAFYGDDDEPRHYFTCHFFDSDGSWAMVTAGHCLRALLPECNKGNLPGQIFLFDPNSPSGVPLPIRLRFEAIIVIDDKETKADYGFVPIDEMYSRELAKAGMTPCSLENVASASEAFEIYYLFGYAWEHARFDVKQDSISVQTPCTALRLT